MWVIMHLSRDLHSMNPKHIMCVHGLLNNTLNLTTYLKIPLKITFFNPLPIRTQYTFPIFRNVYFHQIWQVSIFFINIFYTHLYFSLILSSIFYTFQYKNFLPPIICSIYYVIFSSIYIPQYECMWYGISPHSAAPVDNKRSSVVYHYSQL